MLDDIKNSTDLANLKERINNCSDEELAAAMEEEWLHGIIPDSGISDEDLARIKAEIHEQIGTRKQFTLKRVLKWTQIAAAIALPICMVIMGMMYKENRQYAAIPLTEITTQEGEQVSPKTETSARPTTRVMVAHFQNLISYHFIIYSILD